MRQETWSDLDHELRIIPADALSVAGFRQTARELNSAPALKDEVSALAFSQLAARLAGELRGELQVKPRAILMASALAAYAASERDYRQAATYVMTIKKVARSMTNAARSAVAEAAS